jgi:cyclophilin family peptidyl-prolyl cis-trans isomerase
MRRPALALCAALALAGCGAKTSSTSTPKAAAATAQQPGGCAPVAAPRRRGEQTLSRPTRRLAAGRRYTVALQTNCGTIDIRLATGQAPRTAASFAGLVRRGFYDGLGFHRIARGPGGGGFVIQGGDPLGTGLGGPGFTVVERPPRDLRYTRGTVAMAKTQTEPPGASGSQFFIVTAPDAGLPPDYALVGRVVGGDDAVRRIGRVPTDDQDRPRAPVVIARATLRAG